MSDHPLTPLPSTEEPVTDNPVSIAHAKTRKSGNNPLIY